MNVTIQDVNNQVVGIGDQVAYAYKPHHGDMQLKTGVINAMSIKVTTRGAKIRATLRNTDGSVCSISNFRRFAKIA